MHQSAVDWEYLSLAELCIVLAHQPKQFAHQVVVGVIDRGHGEGVQHGPFLWHNSVRGRDSRRTLQTAAGELLCRSDGVYVIRHPVRVDELCAAEAFVQALRVLEVGQNSVFGGGGQEGGAEDDQPSSQWVILFDGSHCGATSFSLFWRNQLTTSSSSMALMTLKTLLVDCNIKSRMRTRL